MSAPFENDAIGLLGLPFDAVTMDEAERRVRSAVRTRRRLFLSTPNLNFLIAAQSDEAFRRSVLDSDLSLADGMPIVWISRLLGAPLPERVTGSGLFERLRERPPPPGDRPIRLYFFGGPPGAAEAAARRVNEAPDRMVCVGFESPGFGSVEDMSGPDVLARIDASGADFLIVALGAAKGQAWIQRNRSRLQVPVISHLGAVVNFAAGTVSRAPAWVQRAGLEWAWRIKEEPQLWRRYARDARALATLLVGRLLPQAVWNRGRAANDVVAIASREAGGTRIRLAGSAGGAPPPAVLAAMRESLAADGEVVIDVSGLDRFGPRFAALLQRFTHALTRDGRAVRLEAGTARMRRLLRWNGLVPPPA